MTATDHFKQVKAALRKHWVEILLLHLGVLALLVSLILGIPLHIIVV